MTRVKITFVGKCRGCEVAYVPGRFMTRNAPSKNLGYTKMDKKRHRLHDLCLCPFHGTVERASP